MSRALNPLWRYRKLRGQLLRLDRQYFVSPAEVQAAALMGCKTLTVPYLRSLRTGYPLAFIVPAGWYKASYIEREVRVGRGKQQASIDFANRRTRLGLEIDGRDYHDIVADQQRDEWLLKYGWRIKRVPAAMVNPRSKQYNPERVLSTISKWFG